MDRSRGREKGVSRRMEGWECSLLSFAAAGFRKDRTEKSPLDLWTKRSLLKFVRALSVGL